MERHRGSNRRNPKFTRGRVYTSRVNGALVRGSATQLAEKYETLGREAEIDKDAVSAQHYFQAADHYRRIEKQEKEKQEKESHE